MKMKKHALIEQTLELLKRCPVELEPDIKDDYETAFSSPSQDFDVDLQAYNRSDDDGDVMDVTVSIKLFGMRHPSLARDFITSAAEVLAWVTACNERMDAERKRKSSSPAPDPQPPTPSGS